MAEHRENERLRTRLEDESSLAEEVCADLLLQDDVVARQEKRIAELEASTKCDQCGGTVVPPVELKGPNQTEWERRGDRMSWVPRGTDTTDGNFDYRLVSSKVACVHCRQHKLTKIQTYFGDPWELGAATPRIVNPGNAGPDWWGEDHEEALELVTPDGAVAHLYDLPVVFHVQEA